MTFITTPCHLNVASVKGGFWGQKRLFSYSLLSGLLPQFFLLKEDPIS